MLCHTELPGPGQSDLRSQQLLVQNADGTLRLIPDPAEDGVPFDWQGLVNQGDDVKQWVAPPLHFLPGASRVGRGRLGPEGGPSEEVDAHGQGRVHFLA